MRNYIISLVGGQPEPPFHTQRHLLPKDHTDYVRILVSSERTKPVAQRVLKALGLKNTEKHLWDKCPPYDLIDAKGYLESMVETLDASRIVWDLTGGTKPMALATSFASSFPNTEIVYLESESGTSFVYRYQKDRDDKALKMIERSECKSELSLDHYFTLHGHEVQERTSKTCDQGKCYENLIESALKNRSDLEYRRGVAKGNLDIDFVVRRKNQVAVIEAKSGGGAKKGIDQLNTASQRDRFGTYIKKGLIHGQALEENNQSLAEASMIRCLHLNKDSSAGSAESVLNDFFDNQLFT